MPPLFTIGIPTFNRSHFLRRSLAAALAQTQEGVEVLVCDNASTDDTEAVTQAGGAKVRYVRNPSNLGMMGNLVRLVEEARGEYFSFLQDDDVVHRDWAKKALEGFRESKPAVAYLAYLAMSPSVDSWHMPPLYGPSCRMDWMGGSPRVLDGKLMAPLSLFCAFALPPAMAFHTQTLRATLPLWEKDCDHFIECTPLVATAKSGTVVVDPWVAAVQQLHPGQYHLTIDGTADLSRQEQWAQFARWTAKQMEGWDSGWEKALGDLLLEMPVEYRIPWLRRMEKCDDLPATVIRVRDILRQSIGNSSDGKPTSKVLSFKDFAREVTPPFAWRSLQRWRGR